MIDVLIVGGGPTGLTLACDLLRRGVSVRVVDRLSGPMMASKGKGLQPRTLEVFDDLGFVQSVLDAGRTYPPFGFYRDGQIAQEFNMMTIREPSEAVPYPNTIMLPQWKTEQLIAGRLASLGGGVEYDTAFLRLDQADDSVTATVEGPKGREDIKARFLVAADGGRSAVRTHLEVALEGETPDLAGLLVADVHVADLSRDHWHAWGSSLPDAVMLCPLPSTEAFQFTASLKPSENPALSLESLQAYMDHRSGGTGPKLLRHSWISVFRPNVRMVDRYRLDRVFLAGDAAHVHPPTGAQGLNTSVQDAYNLGWKLGAALKSGNHAILDTYEEERLPVAAAVLGRSDLLYRRAGGGDIAALRRGDDEQQLLLNYRGSSAVDAGEPTGAFEPGDRMPNAWLASGTGEAVTLFDLLRGPHATLVSIDAPEPATTRIPGGTEVKRISIRTTGAAEDGGFLATGSALRALSGRSVEVRPDGYVAAIHDAAETAPTA